MIDHEKLKQFVSLFKGLTLTDLLSLVALFKMRRIAAGEIFAAEGSVYNKLAYIQKGLIRAFSVKPNGDELTLLLRWETQFVASHDYVLNNSPSRFNYQAIEGTILFEINYDEAKKIFEKNAGLNQARQHIVLKMLGDSLTRVESFVLFTPQERYLQLIKDKTNIVNRVPHKYLATFLGITPVSLSRIRKRISTK